MEKYELTNETSNYCGRTLYRIKALRDFGDVKKGDLGGYVEYDYALSHDGLCWIYDNAKLYGNARVSDNAKAFGDAEVFGYARVFGNAKVFDNARVYDNAKVFSNAKVFDNAKVSDNALVYDNAQIYGNAEVCGNAGVYNNAQVCGDANVGGKTEVRGDAKVSGNAEEKKEETTDGMQKYKCDNCGKEFEGQRWHLFNKDYTVKGTYCSEQCADTAKTGYGKPLVSETGSVRYNEKKPQLHQVPTELLKGAAECFTRGEAKYGKWNWAKGIEYSVPYDSLLRHLFAWFDGEDNDKETGINHLKHAASNLAMLMYYVERYPDFDDRPSKVLKKGGSNGTEGN